MHLDYICVHVVFTSNSRLFFKLHLGLCQALTRSNSVLALRDAQSARRRWMLAGGAGLKAVLPGRSSCFRIHTLGLGPSSSTSSLRLAAMAATQNFTKRRPGTHHALTHARTHTRTHAHTNACTPARLLAHRLLLLDSVFTPAVHRGVLWLDPSVRMLPPGLVPTILSWNASLAVPHVVFKDSNRDSVFPADIASLLMQPSLSPPRMMPGHPPDVIGENRSEVWRSWSLEEGKPFAAEQADPRIFDFWFSRNVLYERSHMPPHVWEYWAALRDATLFGPYPSRARAQLYESQLSRSPVELANTGCVVFWLSSALAATATGRELCSCDRAVPNSELIAAAKREGFSVLGFPNLEVQLDRPSSNSAQACHNSQVIY